MFHKVRHLYALGADIHLHCFSYGRTPATILEKFCSRVSYYPRKVSKLLLLQSTPYIVTTRVNDRLIREIQKDDAPVLLEGLHCTAQYAAMGLRRRKIMVRAHNVEHDYYRQLARTEPHLFKRIYLDQEAAKLEKYEPEVYRNLPVAAISSADHTYFNQQYGQSLLIPAFHRNDRIASAEGNGQYFLYHGNLGVGENMAAVEWLLHEVQPGLKHPLVIAGQKIPAPMIRDFSSENIIFHPSPTAEKMDQLIREAQVMLLPAMQNTGLKLKLIESLYNGRHVLANAAMANDPVLTTLCHLGEDAATFIEKANQLFDQPFEDADIRRREELMLEYFSNRTAASRLLNALQAS